MKTESKDKNQKLSKITLVGVIITLGIVYGDIGTSPLYVMKAIVSAAGVASQEVILGALSCIIWTLTLQTTVKYILITLRADNKGEGGIFALYALIRKKAKWVFIFAIIGGSTLLADGIITPAITVISAVEGLALVNAKIPILPITIVIICGLFMIQQFGTNFLGKSFGPIMFTWFSMLGILGLVQLMDNSVVIKAFNPYYGIKLLATYPGGFLLLGAVFLCTTGAEALYSDLGHCGLKNIRISWIFVKITLILNYLGQGAWLLTNPSVNLHTINPFYAIMPNWFIMTGVIISTLAAIIASQALISGSYTIISEGILLNFWPRLKIKYPTLVKGQMYIPSINRFLWVACLFVILFFKKSSNMDAAYGLSISITMLMTSVLLLFYFYYKKVNWVFIALFVLVYATIEFSFLVANLSKFMNGGWVTIIIASVFLFIMYVWYRGRTIKNRFLQFVKVDDNKQLFIDVKKDLSIQKYATNLVYITKADRKNEIESKIIFSLFNKNPKRADLYWFLHIDIVDEPHIMEYRVDKLINDTLIRIDLKIGFKVQPRINLYFRYVVNELVKNGEVDIVSRYPSLNNNKVVGDFRFVLIDRVQGYDFDFKPLDQFIMDSYEIIKYIGIEDIKAYGLDTSNIHVEKVPLKISNYTSKRLKRVGN